MKVLKNPYPDGDWKGKTKCKGSKDLGTKGCQAELEISEQDLKLFYWYGDFFEHTYLSANCPICGNILLNLKVPSFVYRRWRKAHPRAQGKFDGRDNRVG